MTEKLVAMGAKIVEELPYVGPDGARGRLLVFEFSDSTGVKTLRLIVPEEEKGDDDGGEV